MEKDYVTVSEINSYLNDKLKSDLNLRNFYIRGEISNYKTYPSGHSYFTLKDESSEIRGVMFSGYKSNLRFEPKDGMKVIINGKIEMYEFKGNIQLYAFNKDLLLSYLDTNDQNDQNNKYVEGIKKFGGKIKKGIFTAGKAVKDKTIKGLNFVKDKVNKDKNDNFTYNNQNK